MMTTGSSMKLLMQKNDSAISVMVPREMKKLIAENARKNSMIESQYIKFAILERFEKDRLGEITGEPILEEMPKLIIMNNERSTNFPNVITGQ